MKFKGAAFAAIILGVYVWIVWPKGLSNQKEDQSSEIIVEKPELKKKEKADRSTKFVSEKDLKNKPQAGEKEDPSLVKQVPAPPLSKELHDELADLRKNGYGKIPPVNLKENLNPQKQSAVEAVLSGNHPERLSVVGKREKFDYERYKENPQEYLNVVVPSRALDSAKPGEGVQRLSRVTSQYIETYQGETVELVVKGAVGDAPVSATVFDGGQFQNDLSAITVQADSNGTATLQFTPTAGVIQNTRITVASPLSSGVVHFNVYVRKKREQAQQ